MDEIVKLFQPTAPLPNAPAAARQGSDAAQAKDATVSDL
jgi:hypothetical protein